MYQNPIAEDDFYWVKIYYLNSTNKVFFKNKEEALFSLNKNKYSILGKINDKFKKDGYFEFLLQYPHNKAYAIWKQRVNPIEADHNTDIGFEMVENINFTGFDGLALSKNEYSLLDGMTRSELWYFAVGVYKSWSNDRCFPGINEDKGNLCIYEANLYIKVYDKEIITQLTGDYKCTKYMKSFNFSLTILISLSILMI